MKIKRNGGGVRGFSDEFPASWLIMQLIIMLASFCEIKLYYRLAG